MSELSDAAARARALTDFDSTLLVEAAAGTGKTSLLAGRIALLMASGASPASIAAITFTKFAADELSTRVREIVDALLAGKIPRSLQHVLPTGLSLEQREGLHAAADRLDGLTTSTIHGFCQDIIRGYAIEADIDPGAQVMDGDAADLAFDQVFDAWLDRRLGGEPRAVDPIAVLARADPRKTTANLRKLANFRRKHRTATAPPANLSGRPDIDLSDAVDGFRRLVNAAAPDDKNTRLLVDLETLDRHFANGFVEPPGFEALWRLANPPPLVCMRGRSFELQRPRHLSSAALSGVSGGLTDAFDVVDSSYRRLLGQVSGAVVAALSTELDEVLGDYAVYKRRAALLDFDDLLERARHLLRHHEPVRQALSQRYRHLLVDEFQDTDPLQCEIIFRLSAVAPADLWTDLATRAGALFLVGDPKQAIFQFRGANVATYDAAKAMIARDWPDNILTIAANFRSRRGIIDYVNATFSDPLTAPLQPGYVALEATRENHPELPSAMRLAIEMPPNPRKEEMQEAEAERVAEICGRLIDAPLLRDAEGNPRPVRPGDIALLAPTRNQLWRYEQALHRVGLPVASQAGNSLYRRQEVQDLVALVRVLADARDTVAFGALMRGPLVGLTDQALLDIAEALPKPMGTPGALTAATPPEHIQDPTARAVVAELSALRRRARFTSPAQLIGEAVERLGVRVTLTLRDPSHASAASANLDVILERATRYGVRGLRRLAADLSAEWRANVDASEGRAEAESDAIAIVTMHSAKGLEWPIVIPINSMVQQPPREQYVLRPLDNTLHWMTGDVASPDLVEVVQADTDSQIREKTRLWYVACTRAQDHLIVPHLGQADSRAWSNIVDLRTSSLPGVDLTGLDRTPAAAVASTQNRQDAARFAEERERIAAVSSPIAWVRPSDHDGDRSQPVEVVSDDLYEDEETWIPVGGRLRGLVLHKLIEEILEENLAEDPVVLESRAVVLRDQLLAPGMTDESLNDLAELAATTLRTLALSEVVELRPRLRAELPIYALVGTDGALEPMSGRADAVAVAEDGSLDVVLDWKSDVAPGPQELADHVEQLRLYLEATGAARGALIYMSLGRVRWVERAPV